MFPGPHSNFAGQTAPTNPSGQQIYSNAGHPSLRSQLNFMNPNSIGFGQPSMQQNVTGYLQSQPTSLQSAPMPLQMQQTGFPSQQIQTFNNGQTPPQQIFQNPTSSMPQLPQNFQNPGQSPQHPEAPTQVSQPTGFAAMADSFKASTLTSQARGRRAVKHQTGVKIPNIRLSFITAQDQAKFETLFKSAVGSGQTLSGEKARDLLLTSKLDGNSLSQIWTLSDTTKSGQLHFPEFALAMYLCNQKLVGRQLPSVLSNVIKNEVSSMVDIINFGVSEDGSESIYSTNTNTTQFLNTQNNTFPSVTNQPQLNIINPNSYNVRMPGLHEQQQHINYQQPTLTGYNQNKQGLQQNQNTIQNSLNIAASGYSAPLPPIPPMPTGFGQNQSLSSTQTGLLETISPLNSQPTGMQAQWGLVNAPATGLPNIDLLQSRMMPQQGREQGGFTTSELKGNAVIPWAVTKEEKKRYDSVFKAWDGFDKGYIGGDVAIEVFGQSGLEKSDLERIWTLADHGNKGRLNMDEFSVAMHLIYRKLNGYPIPLQLPPELVPPSTRNFTDSIGTMKSLLHQESDLRKTSGASLLPQKTGVCYLKSHSFRSEPNLSSGIRKDATVFKNNDDDVGYKSRARHRLGNKNSQPSSPSAIFKGDSSIEELKKKIHEKQVLLDALDIKAGNAAHEDDVLDRRDRLDAEDLYRRVRLIQEDIDAHPDSVLRDIHSGAEYRSLKRQLQALTDKLPEIASQVRTTERSIADAKLRLFRLRDAKANPESASFIVGTGPGGSITESDRLKARAKAMMQQRSAALTGKKIDSKNDNLAAEKRLEEENLRIRTEKENNELMVKDVEESVREFSQSLFDSLDEASQDSTNDHERRRWEEGLGVEDEVKDFIFELQRSSRLARTNITGNTKATNQSHSGSNSRSETSSAKSAQISMKPIPSQISSANSTYKTPEDRAAYIKQQAEQRMAERLAALGIRAPTKPIESTQDRIYREKMEKAAKIRQAEEEDAKREAEHLSKVSGSNDDPRDLISINSKTTHKTPPPPPSRKAVKTDPRKQTANDQKIDELKAQKNEIEVLKDDTALKEAELLKEREASQSRLKALEEQVKARKLKKEEEKKRKKAALAEAKEKESRLASQRAEIEAAKAREYELQKQLESINNEDSSDNESVVQSTLQTPRAQSPVRSEREVCIQPVTLNFPLPCTSAVDVSAPVQSGSKSASFKPGAPKTPVGLETKNPFLAKVPKADTDESHSVQSNNPFHHLPSNETTTQTFTHPSGNRNRVRPEDDEWSVVDSDVEDDSSDDEGPGAGNARQLASILFGTMEPPRPISAASGVASSSSFAKLKNESPGQSTLLEPVPSNPIESEHLQLIESNSETTSTPPPPLLPLPDFNVPPPPASNPSLSNQPPPLSEFNIPPPPPPIPDAGLLPPIPCSGPPPPPPLPTSDTSIAPTRPAGLLGEIKLGKSLKKTQTKDKSGAAVAGRVLN